MRGAAGALLQSCLVLLVRADQWRLQEAGTCDLNRKQSELNSFLWTIKRDPPAYLYGTIHVPYTRVWDFIPENSKQAFRQSQVVYFELDLTDPRTISALTSCQLLPQGESLQAVLPRDIYWRLKRHLEYVKLMMASWMTPDQRGKGLYADYLFNAIAGNWERKRPVWVMLMVNSLTEADIKTRGVPVLDLYLAQEAERMRKKTGAVEKVEEQCHPLNRLNFSQVRFQMVPGPRRLVVLPPGSANTPECLRLVLLLDSDLPLEFPSFPPLGAAAKLHFLLAEEPSQPLILQLRLKTSVLHHHPPCYQSADQCYAVCTAPALSFCLVVLLLDGVAV